MQVLIADPEITCYTGEHAALMVVAAVGLVVYVIGCGSLPGTFCMCHPFLPLHINAYSFPLCAFVALMQVAKRKEHTSSVRLNQFGFLYAR